MQQLPHSGASHFWQTRQLSELPFSAQARQVGAALRRLPRSTCSGGTKLGSRSASELPDLPRAPFPYATEELWPMPRRGDFEDLELRPPMHRLPQSASTPNRLVGQVRELPCERGSSYGNHERHAFSMPILPYASLGWIAELPWMPQQSARCPFQIRPQGLQELPLHAFSASHGARGVHEMSPGQGQSLSQSCPVFRLPSLPVATARFRPPVDRRETHCSGFESRLTTVSHGRPRLALRSFNGGRSRIPRARGLPPFHECVASRRNLPSRSGYGGICAQQAVPLGTTPWRVRRGSVQRRRIFGCGRNLPCSANLPRTQT